MQVLYYLFWKGTSACYFDNRPIIMPIMLVVALINVGIIGVISIPMCFMVATTNHHRLLPGQLEQVMHGKHADHEEHEEAGHGHGDGGEALAHTKSHRELEKAGNAEVLEMQRLRLQQAELRRIENELGPEAEPGTANLLMEANKKAEELAMVLEKLKVDQAHILKMVRARGNAVEQERMVAQAMVLV